MRLRMSRRNPRLVVGPAAAHPRCPIAALGCLSAERVHGCRQSCFVARCLRPCDPAPGKIRLQVRGTRVAVDRLAGRLERGIVSRTGQPKCGGEVESNDRRGPGSRRYSCRLSRRYVYRWFRSPAVSRRNAAGRGRCRKERRTCRPALRRCERLALQIGGLFRRHVLLGIDAQYRLGTESDCGAGRTDTDRIAGHGTAGSGPAGP